MFVPAVAAYQDFCNSSVIACQSLKSLSVSSWSIVFPLARASLFAAVLSSLPCGRTLMNQPSSFKFKIQSDSVFLPQMSISNFQPSTSWTIEWPRIEPHQMFRFGKICVPLGLRWSAWSEVVSLVWGCQRGLRWSAWSEVFSLVWGVHPGLR